MNIIGVCVECLPRSSAFLLNMVFAASLLGWAIYRSHCAERRRSEG